MSKITNPITEASVSCGFFNGNMGLTRKYDSMQMASLFDGILRDGIFHSIGTCFAVTANPDKPNVVIVGPGKAWFNRTWTENTAGLPIDCGAANSGLDRIDAIVIEVNTTDSVLDNFVKVVHGTPSTTPTNPVMVNTDEIHQYALCYIYRKADSEDIYDRDITPKVGTSETPFATGVMETANIDDLYAAWDDQFKHWSAEKTSEFESWFNGIQDALSDDVAGNLMNQINTIRGTALNKNCRFELAYQFKTAGTHIWKPSDNARLAIFVLVGAGEGGWSGSDYKGGSGGNGGEVVISDIVTLTPNEPINIVVGAGGAGGICPSVSHDNVAGSPGGSTSCLGMVANGGNYLDDNFSMIDRTDIINGFVKIDCASDSISKWYINIDECATSPRTSLGKSYLCGWGGVGGSGGKQYVSDNKASLGGLASHARLPVAPFGVLSAGGGGGGYYNAYDHPTIWAGASGVETALGFSGTGGTAVSKGSVPGSPGANGCGGGGGSGHRAPANTSDIGAGGRGGDGYVAIYVLKGDIA